MSKSSGGPRVEGLRKRLGLTNTVYYDAFDPASAQSTHGRNSLTNLDYSPLKRITWASLYMALLVSMGGFIYGYDTGQISGFLAMPDFLRRFGQQHQHGEKAGEYYFSNVRSGLITGLLSIGTLIGALTAGPLADVIGRKYSIVIWCCVFCVGNTVQIASTDHWYQVMMGRWVAGLSIGGLSLLVPMYMAETGPRHIRGALISCYQLFITFGIFLAACLNYACYEHQRHKAASWRIVMGVGYVWAVILGVGILAFPETPRFQYRRGKIQEAKATMMRVYGAPENHYAIYVELEEIEQKLRAESAKGSTLQEWSRMLSAPKMAYRILLGIALQMFQQLTGSNYFFYYGTTVFKGTGINNSFVTQMILNGINFGSTFYGLYIIEHHGRRPGLIMGSIWMFMMFLIFASVGHFSLDRSDPSNTQSASIAMICMAAFFIFGFATTWGPMIWTICGELYPSRYRARGMAFSTASNWLWNFLIAFFTPFITSAIDFRYGYVFAACNVLGGLIVYFFVLEGQGRTLEELDTMYLSNVLPWKSSKWVAPPPEEIARIRKEAGTGGEEDGIETVPKENGETRDAQHEEKADGQQSGAEDSNGVSKETAV